MTEQKSITAALYGGSFNPPHLGHVMGVGWALAMAEVDEVWVIPSGGHPFGKQLAPFDDRLKMCRLAFEIFGDRVKVLDVERERGVHYSVQTAAALAQRRPEVKFRWLMGSDALNQSDEWQDFDCLCRIAPPLIMIRQGHACDKISTTPGAESPGDYVFRDVSSTQIRQWLGDSKANHAALSVNIPASVLDYLAGHPVYASLS